MPANDVSPPVEAEEARPTQVEEIVSLIGPKLYELRRARGYSLQQLATISDVSSAAIHKIERNGMVPTITTLLKLGTALGVQVSHFVAEEGMPPERVKYTPAEQRPVVYTPHKGLSLAGITGSYRQFETAAAMATVIPGANSGEKLLQHPGEEVVHVVEGVLTFDIGGQSYALGEGDTLHFGGEVPHQWGNQAKRPARAIWIALRGS
ncbi:cupin domain-containing protein [Planosporangium flavigriseum]|uniref:XRE family transcriptional regulator n=1 Tax=Planosporangium flavigriseum TaxID=373681 RepID=A0A8J3LM80_9ACTN|nr:cupin domain-containing protein [Planosporangium flavigriseum]NJC63035.1 cupin domain-containing protein [Planosporangium flavigriseum]GIG73093.1 XRE family transcriptional regulator [Planosporangium flavigriseum]